MATETKTDADVSDPNVALSAPASFGQVEEMGRWEDKLQNLPDFDTIVKSAEHIVPGTVDKDMLVGIPLAIVKWSPEFSENFKADYVKIACVVRDAREIPGSGATKANEPIFFTDFGSGIGALLDDFAKRDPGKPIYCPQGLRKSEYGPHQNSAGVDVPGGVTYYLS